jgi:hypothetical protein
MKKIAKQRFADLACSQLHAGFLLGLFFNLKAVGDMFFRNIGWLSMDNMVLYPRK